ncbi:ABC transporter ATP-binding protein [Paenibacillus alvei]|uniref:ABC transporter ATP-binding protein n=1 Tax=Paenibacillus alvei TaxID=44250 RepID=UPI0003866516|nr:ABC transporter ATP-binding protein [Paenibacillus alvei]EPY14029.1 ABC transporter related protein [Paenibacillus alvei A6-6i-x]
MVYSGYQELLRLVHYMKRRRKSYLFALLGSSLIESCVPIMMTMMVKTVLDAVVEKDIGEIWGICIQLSIIIVVIAGLTPLFQYWFGRTVKLIMNDLRMLVFQHFINLPVSYYENRHSGDALSKVSNDLGVVENIFTGNIRQIITLFMLGGYAAVLMFFLDWRLTIAFIAIGGLSTVINSKFAKPIRKYSTQIQSQASLQIERLTDLLAGTQTSRIFHLADKTVRKYKEANHLIATLSVSRETTNASLNVTNYLLIWINNFLAFIIGTIMLMNNQTTLGTLFALILLMEHVTNLFRFLGSLWANLQNSLAGAARVFELLDQKEEPRKLPVNPSNFSSHHRSEMAMIEIEQGQFSYENGEEILNQISFSVERGQMVALVGPSGGGKSTIIKLLLGFYPLNKGEIRIEGKNISDFTLSDLRNRMAYVSQDHHLLTGTIMENIRYGRVKASDEEVISAAKAAHAHDFIMELENGYDTLVGERGGRLSGGQKQRVTIARALLKNAPILLLDEATSALDSSSEQAVQHGLQQLMKGKTTIAIAHRLSTVQQADVIFVIDKGRIVEQGTHAELTNKDHGLYNRLNNIQMG